MRGFKFSRTFTDDKCFSETHDRKLNLKIILCDFQLLILIGRNEGDIVKGIKDSGVDRKRVFIVYKVAEHGYDVTIKAVKDSLSK